LLPRIHQVRDRRRQCGIACHGRLEGTQRLLFFAEHAVSESEVVPDFAALGAERDGALEMLARVDRRIVVQARGTETDPDARLVRRERHAFGQHVASGASGTGYLERVAELVHQIHVAGMAAQAFAGDLLRLRRLAALQQDECQHRNSMQ
jgi:hypothetical protein